MKRIGFLVIFAAVTSFLVVQADPSSEGKPVLPASNDHPGVSPQATLAGFLNISWGSSEAVVRKQIQVQGFVETSPDEKNCVTYKGGNFANLPVRTLKLRFFHDQFYGALVVLEPTDDQKGSTLSLRLALTAKYGQPTDVKYDAPESTLGSVALFWTFQDQNTLALSTHSDIISLYYRNVPFANAADIEASGINPSNL